MTRTMKQRAHRLGRKQAGAAIMDNLIAVGFVALAIVFIFAQVPKLQYQWNKVQFQSQTSEIVQATVAWKKSRPNFDAVSINKVCLDGELSHSICGAANDGKATNPFGGDWSVTVNTGSKGLFDVKATLPSDANHVVSLSNTMSAATRGNCIEATGCSTIKVAGTALTMTF
uniref:Uncharacterized protein n=1 Tax=Vibrio tasmaniensis TaxID=212663 RepID=A0A0H4A282_9VIBR|nr:hypothetical protein [Vibrio tasmaniensis]AKN40719.1 hypothetical protein [Vibrio tasmaniensis]